MFAQLHTSISWINFSVTGISNIIYLCAFAHYFIWKCELRYWSRAYLIVENTIKVPNYYMHYMAQLWYCILNCDLSIFNFQWPFCSLLAWLLASVFYTKKGFSIEEPDFLFSPRYWKVKVETKSQTKSLQSWKSTSILLNKPLQGYKELFYLWELYPVHRVTHTGNIAGTVNSAKEHANSVSGIILRVLLESDIYFFVSFNAEAIPNGLSIYRYSKVHAQCVYP